MTQLKDLGDVADTPEVSIFKHTKIWNQPVSTITPQKLFAAATRLKSLFPDQQSEIKQAVHLLIAEAQKELILGNVDQAPFTYFVWPEGPTPVPEVTRIVRLFKGMERKAILLALLKGWHIREAVKMKRTALPQAQSEYELHLYKSCPARLGCSYLFWRDVGFHAEPLLDLEPKFMRVAKMSWGHFSDMCKSLAQADDHSVTELRSLAG